MPLDFRFSVTLAAALSLTDFPEDQVVYHAKTSTDLAAVPLAGTGTPGTTIQARAVSLDDGGHGTTAWADIATVTGGGTWSAYHMVPRLPSWYRAEVRRSDQPATVVQSSNRFASGAVACSIGQSEDAKIAEVFSGSNATATVLPRLRHSVEALKYNGKLCGRQSTAALKVPGVDTMPAGWSYNAGAKFLTISSGAHHVTDWDFSDIAIQVNSGVSFGFENCYANYVEGSALFFMVRYISGSTCTGIEWNTITSPGGVGNLNPALKLESGCILAGNITRNRIEGIPSDPIWISAAPAGTTRWIAWNYIHATRNMPAGSAAWNSGTSYLTGDGVFQGGYAYLAARNNTNAAPTGTTSSNADWTYYDPHLDFIYFTGGDTGTIRVENNLMEADDTPLLRGVNNHIRISLGEFSSQGSLGPVVVENNRMTRAAGGPSYPFQLYTTGGYSLGDVTIRWNDMVPTSGGNYIHPSVAGSARIWGENTNLLTGAAITAPSEATATDATADTTGDGDFQVVWHDRSPEGSGAAGVQRQLVSTSSYLYKQFTGAADCFLRWRPGEKMTLILAGDPGRGFQDYFDDTDADSYWLDDLAAITRGRAGGHVGLMMSSWYASPQGLGLNYANVYHQLIAGKRTDGAAITPRAPIYSTGSTVYFDTDHLWSELFDYTETQWMVSGPHVRMPDVDMQNSTLRITAVGGQFEHWTLVNYGRIRDSLRSLFPTAYTSFVAVKGVDRLNVEFGRPDGGGGWTDDIHPSYFDDGSKRYAALTVLGALHALALVPWDVPEIDNAFWAPGGTYMEMWSSAWEISTTRLARGDAAMALTYPHRTDVFAVEIDGFPAENVAIVAGRIRVTPNSGTFNATTVITFGEGAATGMIKYPQDPVEGAWKNYPVGVFPHGPVAGIEGIALRPKPNPAVLASTL